MKIWQWTGFQEKTLWDWLDLLLVPLMIAIGITVIETAESRRQEYNLSELYKQEILRDYFEEINKLVFDKTILTRLRETKEYDPEREVLGARIVTTLEILGEDKKRKSQIIRFIGNASLSRVIPIRRANLANLDLSYVDLTGIDLRLTSLEGANLCGANLIEANLDGAILANAQYSDETLISDNLLSAAQLQSMKKQSSKSCGDSE